MSLFLGYVEVFKVAGFIVFVTTFRVCTLTHIYTHIFICVYGEKRKREKIRTAKCQIVKLVGEYTHCTIVYIFTIMGWGKSMGDVGSTLGKK